MISDEPKSADPSFYGGADESYLRIHSTSVL